MCAWVWENQCCYSRWKNGGDWAGNRDERGNTETETKKCMIKKNKVRGKDDTVKLGHQGREGMNVK